MSSPHIHHQVALLDAAAALDGGATAVALGEVMRNARSPDAAEDCEWWGPPSLELQSASPLGSPSPAPAVVRSSPRIATNTVTTEHHVGDWVTVLWRDARDSKVEFEWLASVSKVEAGSLTVVRRDGGDFDHIPARDVSTCVSPANAPAFLKARIDVRADAEQAPFALPPARPPRSALSKELGDNHAHFRSVVERCLIEDADLSVLGLEVASASRSTAGSASSQTRYFLTKTGQRDRMLLAAAAAATRLECEADAHNDGTNDAPDLELGEGGSFLLHTVEDADSNAAIAGHHYSMSSGLRRPLGPWAFRRLVLDECSAGLVVLSRGVKTTLPAGEVLAAVEARLQQARAAGQTYGEAAAGDKDEDIVAAFWHAHAVQHPEAAKHAAPKSVGARLGGKGQPEWHWQPTDLTLDRAFDVVGATAFNHWHRAKFPAETLDAGIFADTIAAENIPSRAFVVDPAMEGRRDHTRAVQALNAAAAAHWYAYGEKTPFQVSNAIALRRIANSDKLGHRANHAGVGLPPEFARRQQHTASALAYAHPMQLIGLMADNVPGARVLAADDNLDWNAVRALCGVS